MITRESEDEQRPVWVSAYPPQIYCQKQKVEYLSPQTWYRAAQGGKWNIYAMRIIFCKGLEGAEIGWFFFFCSGLKHKLKVVANAIFLFDSYNIDKYISSKSFLSTLLVQNKIETLAEFKGWLKGISLSLFEQICCFLK